jgi:hypothetical protein
VGCVPVDGATLRAALSRNHKPGLILKARVTKAAPYLLPPSLFLNQLYLNFSPVR